MRRRNEAQIRNDKTNGTYKTNDAQTKNKICFKYILFVCVEVLRPSQPNGVISSAVSLPNHTFPGQA